MKNFVLHLLSWYQKRLNWIWGPSVCRFQPTCSVFCYQAIEKYGILTGLFKGLRRLATCHAGTPLAYDPVK